MVIYTALAPIHEELKAKMVEFAGHSLPLYYKGIMDEHLFTRSKESSKGCSIFDVSHMGQVFIADSNIALLKPYIPLDFEKIRMHQAKYSLFLNHSGGIHDDVIVTRRESGWYCVFNGGCIQKVLTILNQASIPYQLIPSALIAIQGNQAKDLLANYFGDVSGMDFMSTHPVVFNGEKTYLSRLGYTGEDGFELSLSASQMVTLVRSMLSYPYVAMAGLGARDSLRLEAGYCLYGQDITEETSPVEADLLWAMSPSRKKALDFNGSQQFQLALQQPQFKRAGWLVEGKIPVRAGTLIYNSENSVVGRVTSGVFSPSLNCPIAMGYLAVNHQGSMVAKVRDNAIKVTLTSLPFVTTYNLSIKSKKD